MARRGGDKLFKKAKEKRDFMRTINNRYKRGNIIIACEDSVSSPAYFKIMIDQLIKEKKITPDSIVIVAHDGATHPTGVLDNLKNYKDESGRKYSDFDYKWIVIDRDIEKVNGAGHTTEDFNNALKNTKHRINKFHIDIAYANDSFELWYLLHFEYRNTAILRDEIILQVIKRLKEIDRHKFAKSTKDNIKQENYTKLIFETLKPLQNVAVQNAKKLLASHGEGHNPESDNPSTTIHSLVILLNSLFNNN